MRIPTKAETRGRHKYEVRTKVAGLMQHQADRMAAHSVLLADLIYICQRNPALLPILRHIQRLAIKAYALELKGKPERLACTTYPNNHGEKMQRHWLHNGCL